MLTGVEILLERMKTNPEEFVEGALSKWSRVIDYSWQILTEEERNALQNGMKEAKREHFNGEVMRVLAQGHDEQVTMDTGLYASGYSQNLAKSLAATKNTVASSILTPQSIATQANQLLRNEMSGHL